MTGIEVNPESRPVDLPGSLCSTSKGREKSSRPSATFQRGVGSGKKGEVSSQLMELVLAWSQAIMAIMVMPVP